MINSKAQVHSMDVLIFKMKSSEFVTHDSLYHTIIPSISIHLCNTLLRPSNFMLRTSIHQWLKLK